MPKWLSKDNKYFFDEQTICIKKKCTFAAQNYNQIINKKTKYNYVESLRNRFHYDSRFV